MRFEFSQEMIAAARQGAALGIGISHADYTRQLEPLPENIRASLMQDFAA
jgi:hypothetical protein